MMKNRLLILFLPLLLSVVPAAAKGLSAEKRKEISQMLTRILDREVAGCKTNVTQVVDAGNRLTLYASIGMSYYPFRERSVAAIYDSIRSLLPASLARRRLSLVTDKHPIEELIPQIYRSGSRGKTFTNRSDRPLVTRLSSPVKPTHGLAGRHIAMWQSHGRYFDQEENRWRWQRSRLWETCEDLYTQSYVLPYLVPMLELAGANVLLPRERDVQTEEAIADNDAGVDEGSSYVEFTGDRRWFDAGTGFAHRREVYVECQNPFAEGTARGVQTVTDGRESRAEWSADLPASGEYAVYVSYKTVERSSEDALYTVRHLGGESRFAVNQTMGGGTWIYLGTFRFAAGQNPALVTLSNRSSKKNRVVTADAVKIGGGMGNVARTPAAEFRTQDTDYFCEPSGYPRFCEGARYWLQWAGFPETVYRQKEGLDDYKEDYMSRAHWVNALMGGSERLPDEEGLNIPVDMALAFHSDAGVEFRVFPEGLRRALGEFTASGRSLFVSGSFIATDPWRSPASTDEERAFVKSVLRYDYRGGQASRRGEARIVASPARMDRERFYFNTEPCRDFYPVEAPDALRPVGGGFIVMRYDDGDQTAAVGYTGDYRSLAMGFPFEAIVDEGQRDRLMQQIMNFLEPRK